MLRKIDTWIGKYLFIPPIIKICQITGWHQRTVGTYLFIAAMLAVIASWKFFGLVSFVLFVANVVMVSIWIARAAKYIYMEPVFGSSPFIGRCLVYVTCAIAMTAPDAWSDRLWWNIAITLLFLAMMYAMEIKTIPPTEVKEKEEKTVLVPQRIKR